MERRGISPGSVLAVLVIILLFSIYFLNGGEVGIGDSRERDSNDQYGAKIITEGSSFSLLLNEGDIVNDYQTVEIIPPLPTGIKLFKDNWSLGEKTLDMFGEKICVVSMNGGFGCLDSSEITTPITWHYPPEENSVYSAVSVGGNHYCSILELEEGSEIYCWGSNTNGQLGNHSEYFPEEAVKVSKPEVLIWDNIVTGESHSCASTFENSVYCWGMGSLGQIGNGNLGDSIIPSKVNFEVNSEILVLEAGQNHNCVLFSSNIVECWGWNGWGQIGDGTFEDRASPSKVNLSEGIVIIDLFLGSLSSCVLSEEMEIFCWGDNSNKQISNGASDSILLPSKIGYSGEVQGLLIGDDEICILSIEGNVICDKNRMISLIDLEMDVRQIEYGKFMCFVSDIGIVSCHNWEDGAKSEEIHWIIGMSEIPTRFTKGQISGVPLQNYNGVHKVFFNGSESMDFDIVISVDFSKDEDRDGWSKIHELECGTSSTDTYSFPIDSDGDNICDYLDEDDDNDGFLDEDDSFPLNPEEWEDDDYDGIGKNSDSYEKWEPTLGLIITMGILGMIFFAETKRKDRLKIKSMGKSEEDQNVKS